jgi:predicted enzyme related to lactoylglutathione lyase
MSKAFRFLVYADDPERAVKFYTEVLGWKFDKTPAEMGGGNHFWINAGSDDEEGIGAGDLELRIGNRSTVNHYRVVSFKDTINKITKYGGKIINETALGEMGFQAFCEDSEGNVFSIFQPKNPE